MSESSKSQELQDISPLHEKFLSLIPELEGSAKIDHKTFPPLDLSIEEQKFKCIVHLYPGKHGKITVNIEIYEPKGEKMIFNPIIVLEAGKEPRYDKKTNGKWLWDRNTPAEKVLSRILETMEGEKKSDPKKIPESSDRGGLEAIAKVIDEILQMVKGTRKGSDLYARFQRMIPSKGLTDIVCCKKYKVSVRKKEESIKILVYMVNDQEQEGNHCEILLMPEKSPQFLEYPIGLTERRLQKLLTKILKDIERKGGVEEDPREKDPGENAELHEKLLKFADNGEVSPQIMIGDHPYKIRIDKLQGGIHVNMYNTAWEGSEQDYIIEWMPGKSPHFLAAPEEAKNMDTIELLRKVVEKLKKCNPTTIKPQGGTLPGNAASLEKDETNKKYIKFWERKNYPPLNNVQLTIDEKKGIYSIQVERKYSNTLHVTISEKGQKPIIISLTDSMGVMYSAHSDLFYRTPTMPARELLDQVLDLYNKEEAL